MRCALLLFAVLFFGLFTTVGELVAQQPYYNPSTPNYGFAPRPDNWQPAAAPNWFQQPQAIAARQPIGSAVQSGPTQSPGSIGYAQTTATQYPTAQYSANQYPTAEYPTAQYSAPQYSAAQYPAVPPTMSPAYLPPTSVPSMRYPGVSDAYAGSAAVGTPSGRLFEASAYDTGSSGGPTHHGPGQSVPSSGAPQYSAPQYSAPQYSSPMQGGVVQNGITQSGPATQFWSSEAACGPDGCESKVGPVYSTPASRWFAGVYGLIMTRDQENNVWLSYETTNILNRVLKSHDANANYSGGFETRFGRFFGCGSTAFEVVYWGIFPGAQEANALATDIVGDLDTILHFDGISYDPGTGPQLVSSAFFQADRHYLRREYSLHNVELNVFETNYNQACGCGNLNLSWAAGIRYVKFDESFLYSTDPIDTTFDGAPEELHYGIETSNNLIGFQVGGRADLCIKPGFTSYIDTKLGMFANRSSQHSRIFGSNGLAEVSDVVSPYFGTPMDIQSNKTDASFVAEFRAGLDYQFSSCWSATIGYRAVALTGVALSTNQIPVDFIGAIDSVRSVDTNGCLIAHGGFAGLEYNY